MISVCKTRGSASIWTPAVACRASDWSGRSRNGSEGASVWSELRERVAQYDSRTSDMRLGGGGVSPSVEARNFTDRGGLLPCPTWGHSLATVLMLGVLWSGLAACMLGALSYDIAYWFGV